jgi:hypothetical protein
MASDTPLPKTTGAVLSPIIPPTHEDSPSNSGTWHTVPLKTRSATKQLGNPSITEHLLRKEVAAILTAAPVRRQSRSPSPSTGSPTASNKFAPLSAPEKDEDTVMSAPDGKPCQTIRDNDENSHRQAEVGQNEASMATTTEPTIPTASGKSTLVNTSESHSTTPQRPSRLRRRPCLARRVTPRL